MPACASQCDQRGESMNKELFERGPKARRDVPGAGCADESI
jgi:hypothetical protein